MVIEKHLPIKRFFYHYMSQAFKNLCENRLRGRKITKIIMEVHAARQYLQCLHFFIIVQLNCYEK